MAQSDPRGPRGFRMAMTTGGCDCCDRYQGYSGVAKSGPKIGPLKISPEKLLYLGHYVFYFCMT